MVRNATVIIFLGLIFYFYNYQMVLGELSTGDIAQFTPKQKYTYQMIGMRINTTENNSTLTSNEIQNQIMEYFIVNGFSYCNLWIDNQYAGYCGDNGSTAITLGNKVVRNEFIKIVGANQPSPLDGVLKFFGGFVIPTAYAQPIEDNWNNIPSHAVNGEINMYVYLAGVKPLPSPSPLDVEFDIQNVKAIRMVYEENTNFSFNPFEENASVLWQDMFYIENNNQTVRKPFALELIINDVKNVGADVMHSGYGALKIGSNVWNPIAGAVWTTPTGTLIEMDVFSYVDRYPIG